MQKIATLLVLLCYGCLPATCVFFSASTLAAGASERLAGRVVASQESGSLAAIDWKQTKDRLNNLKTIKLRYFIRGERGGEELLMHDLRRGRAQIGVISLSGLASAAPELQIAAVAGLFESEAEAAFVYDNYLFDLSNEVLAQKGLRLIQRVAESSNRLKSGRFRSFAVVVNRDWFNDATEAQQIELANAWVRIAPQITRVSVPAAGDTHSMNSGKGSDTDLGRDLPVNQLVARLGGRSAEFYAAVMRGKLAFSAR